MSDFSSASIAVTGASGHLGRRVIELLLEKGARRVVGVSRAPEKLADLAQRGVDARAGSFDDPASLETAFAGVERVLVISTDTLMPLGHRLKQHIAAIDAAKAAGAGYVAYTSLTSPYPDPTNPIADSHFWTEVHLAQSGLDWSSLRNNQYTDFLLPGARQAIETGTLYHAAGGGHRAYVTREDCAAAAAGALLGADGQRIFDIGGPAALTGDDLADILSRLSGKPINAVSVPGAAFADGLSQAGIPAEMAGLLARFDTDAAKGYLGIVTGDVEQLSGRPAQSVEAFLTANKVALGL